MSISLVIAWAVLPNFAQSLKYGKTVENKSVKVFSALEAAERWFSAWELVSKKFYKIKTIKPVEFVFFDDKYIYSTSNESVPNGEIIGGPQLFDKKLIWKRGVHNGKIMLPNRQIVPVGLMSFAAPLETENQSSFFVMPLPEFWRNAKVESAELGLEKLLTGVFLHEFAHTQQMQSFGRKLSEYEQRYKFEVEFSDDVIQHYFEKDAVYNSAFREEVALFYAAAANSDKTKTIELIEQSIEKLESRQQKYFRGDKEHFKEIDDFFLTMEGIGQFTMYLWLTDTKGGNIPPDIALKGVRRGGKSWSQEAGLPLFLILGKLSKTENWSKQMFGKEPESVIKIIRNELKKKNKSLN
jgi:hypothetical protein